MRVNTQPQKKEKLTLKRWILKLRMVWPVWRRRILLFVLAVSFSLFLALLPSGARRSLLLSLLALRSFVILLLVFSLLILSLLWTSGERMDAVIFILFNLRGVHPRWLDRVMWWITQIGNGVVTLVGASFLYLVGMRRLSLELVLGTLSMWLVVETVKTLTDRARPFILLEDVRVIGWREPGLSFPSGHTAQTFFLMTFLGHYFEVSPFVSFALYSVAVLVGFTRMYVGAHYPRDVIAGALLGSVWGILVTLIDTHFLAPGI